MPGITIANASIKPDIKKVTWFLGKFTFAANKFKIIKSNIVINVYK